MACAADARCSICERRGHWQDASFFCWVTDGETGWVYRCCRVCHDSINLEGIDVSLHVETLQRQLLHLAKEARKRMQFRTDDQKRRKI